MMLASTTPIARSRLPVLQVSAPRKVAPVRGLHDVDACEKVVEERQPGHRRKPSGAPVIELGKSESRNDEVFRRGQDQVRARAVIRIRGVQGGEQRTGVQDQRHSAGCFGDRFGCQLRGALSIGRAGDAEARPPRLSNRARLLLDRVAQHDRQWHVAALRLGLQRPNGCFGGADRGATECIS